MNGWGEREVITLGTSYRQVRAMNAQAALNGPKIVWQEIQFHSCYSWENGHAIVNNKVFFLPTDDLALLGVLCSPLQWWHLTRVLPHMKDEALSPAAFVMEHVQIATGTSAQGEAISAAVTILLQPADQLHVFEQEACATACRCFELPEADGRVVSWLCLPAETYARGS